MPFDRLIAAVDQWARRERRKDIFAQIGDGSYLPRSFDYARRLTPADFRQRVIDADLIVAHAGMGSILTALELGRPIVVMPRRGELMETRNDHQIATARKLSAHGQVTVAMDDAELMDKLQQVSQIRCADQIGPFASPPLLRTLRKFIATGQLGVEPALPTREVEPALVGG